MKKTTLAEWSEQWLEMVKPLVKGNTYAASYICPKNNHILPYFGRLDLCSVRQIEVQKYLNTFAKQKYSLDTVKKHKSCLYQLFKSAMDNDL
jgi:hypothetical protein